MFSRQDLGRAFGAPATSASAVSAAPSVAAAPTRAHRDPTKEADLHFQQPVQRPAVARLYRGEAPAWVAAGAGEVEEEDALWGARRNSPLPLAQQLRPALPQAPRPPAPLPRIAVEAEVIVAVAAAALEAVADEAEAVERRRRVRERHHAAPLAAPPLSASSTAAYAFAPAAGGPTAGSVARDAAPSMSADGDGEGGEEDVAARRARVRERLRIHRQEELQVEVRQRAAVAADAPATLSQSVADAVAPILAAATSTRRIATEATVLRASGESAGEEGAGEGDEDDEDEDESPTEASAAAAATRASWGQGRKLVRPVFRSKEQRATLREAEEHAAEEARAIEESQRLVALRAEESRRMVAESLLRENEAAAAGGDADGTAADRLRPDDSDIPENADAEFEEWRLRELRRLKRDSDAAAAAALEISETARRRALAPEARELEDRALEQQGLKVFRKVKEKWRFMQRYHHRGAFYVDEASLGSTAATDVRTRSAAEAAELEAGHDKATLPLVMQVRAFGRKGQSKYTHLVDQDTTRTSADLFPALQSRLDAVRGGTKDLDGRARR